MKKVRIKLIISILLMIGIILISPISMAGIDINGQYYFTSNDISFYDGQIHVIGGPGSGTYYCTNHNRNLTGRNGRQ